ncbi:MAG: GreA/GreB family elongation factor [Cytophagales bacterium]|nr:GreA/GreB family elongation factor [Cytophagales bacterium]
MEEYWDIKSSLYEQCRATVEARITSTGNAMDTARQAANLEAKSSVGDKYETDRAMMQLEMEKLTFQMEEALKLRKVLHQISIEETSRKVDLGSVVKTSMGNFFVAVPAGKMDVNDTVYFTISLASPIGQALYGHKENEKIVFNGKEVTIHQIF